MILNMLAENNAEILPTSSYLLTCLAACTVNNED